jgi:poly-gamma-glutamate system protein
VRVVPRIDRGLTRRIVLAAVVSLAAWASLAWLSPRPTVTWTAEMREASGRMRTAIDVIAGYHETAGIEIDEAIDPNRTGLIGPEYTDLYTSLGQLEAKRTTTNPDLAALMVHLLRRAGVARGDTIGVGASASFPALMIATLAASEAIGAHPVAIVSLGASSYGATRPDLDLLHIYQLLLAANVIATPPAAISLGGEGDVGTSFEPAFREELLDRVRTSGVPLVNEPAFRENVARRLAIYLGAGEAVAAFVNIGGNDANLGRSPLILGVAPGLHESLPLPGDAERGVLYEMSARGVPVIHLLHVRGLARSHGLPWDPVPLPEPGTTTLTRGDEERGLRFWLVIGGYFAALLLILAGRFIRL